MTALGRSAMRTGASLAVALTFISEAAFACQRDVPPPRYLSGWNIYAGPPDTNGVVSVTLQGFPSASRVDSINDAKLVHGELAGAILHDVADVEFVVEPGRAPEAGTHAGLLSFRAPLAGLYAVTFVQGAWVDVLEGGVRLKPVREGYLFPCTYISQAFAFELQPGPHVVQISGVKAEAAMVLIGYTPPSSTDFED